MSDAAPKDQGTEQIAPLPFEKAAAEAADPEKSLFDLLGSDEDFAEEPKGESEPESKKRKKSAPKDDADEDADDDDAEDEDEGQSDEDDDSDDSDDSDDDEDEDEDDGEDADEDEDDDDDFETVTVNGEEVKVTLDELKKGYSRTADYTRKTQELATQRKAVEADAVAMREAREQYAQHLKVAAALVAKMVPEEVDLEALKESDPAKFAVEFAKRQDAQQKLAILKAENDKILAEQQAELEKAHGEWVEEQKAALLKALPEWSDKKIAQKEKRAMWQTAQEAYGFTEDELKQVGDHRLMILLRDAMRYRNAATKGKKIAKEGGSKKTGKVLTPGSADRRTGRSKSKRVAIKRRSEALARSGRTQDAAGLIEHLLGDDD